jgi:hypothetical protein
MTNRTEGLNVRRLAGAIDAEISMASNFHDLTEDLKVGGLPSLIDTHKIRKMLKNEFDGFQNALDIMLSVLARHCGEKLVNCNGMPVDALPDKQLERFGPDEDNDFDPPEPAEKVGTGRDRKMTEQIKQLNIRELAGEIDTEIKLGSEFHDLTEKLKIGEMSFSLDTHELRKMLDNEFEGYQSAMEILLHVLARHCGEELVNCDEMAVEALPDKHLERFGPDEDDES